MFASMRVCSQALLVVQLELWLLLLFLSCLNNTMCFRYETAALEALDLKVTLARMLLT